MSTAAEKKPEKKRGDRPKVIGARAVPRADADDLEPIVDVVALARAKRGSGRRADRRLVLPLAELRAAAGRTQVELSRAGGLLQGDVSKLENREDLEAIAIATLRKYVRGLGGELELVACLSNGARVILETAPPPKPRRRSR